MFLPVWPQQCSPWLLLLNYFYHSFPPNPCPIYVSVLLSVFIQFFASPPSFPLLPRWLNTKFFYALNSCSILTLEVYVSFLMQSLQFLLVPLFLSFHSKLSPISPPLIPLLKYLLKWKVFWILGVANQRVSLFCSETCTRKDLPTLSCWVWKFCSEMGEGVKWCNLLAYLSWICRSVYRGIWDHFVLHIHYQWGDSSNHREMTFSVPESRLRWLQAHFIQNCHTFLSFNFSSSTG